MNGPKIIGSGDIITWTDAGTADTHISTSKPIPEEAHIMGGPGIIVDHNFGTKDYTVSIDPYNPHPLQPQTPAIQLAKPIFILGIPIGHNQEYYKKAQHKLEERMIDYHVIVIKNTTDKFTAKTFAGDSITDADIDEIKKYIDQK